MWYKISIVLCISICLIASVREVQAIDLGTDKVDKAAVTAGYDPGTTDTSFSRNIGKVVSAILSIVGVLFTVLLVYAGYLWMTASGDDSKIEKAKSILTSSIIGLIILLMAYSITNFVVPKLLEGSIQEGVTEPEPVCQGTADCTGLLETACKAKTGCTWQ